MKLFVQTVLGIVALIAGVACLYFFISGLSKGVNFMFLIGALILIGVGSFLFIRISKIENTVNEGELALDPAATESGSKLLEKNNQMIKEWTKTTTKKDHLKAVQIAVNAEAQARKEEGA